MRQHAARSAQELADMLTDGAAPDDVVIKSYLSSKVFLAGAFQALMAEKYDGSTELQKAVAAVQREMVARYPGIPDHLRKVRGFSTAHKRLLAMLAERRGRPVSVDELRLATGDAIHTERRARELRALGFAVETRHTAGEDAYVLGSAEQDVASAAPALLRRNIEESSRLSTEEKEALLAVL